MDQDKKEQNLRKLLRANEATTAPAGQSFSTDTKEGLIQKLTEVAEDPANKVTEQLAAMKQIASLRGFDDTRGQRDLTRRTPEELEQLVREIVMPALMRFGVSAYGYSDEGESSNYDQGSQEVEPRVEA